MHTYIHNTKPTDQDHFHSNDTYLHVDSMNPILQMDTWLAIMLSLQHSFQFHLGCEGATSIKIHGFNRGRLTDTILLREAENYTEHNILPYS